jgi:hypothetical protein
MLDEPPPDRGFQVAVKYCGTCGAQQWSVDDAGLHWYITLTCGQTVHRAKGQGTPRLFARCRSRNSGLLGLGEADGRDRPAGATSGGASAPDQKMPSPVRLMTVVNRRRGSPVHDEGRWALTRLAVVASPIP